LIEHPRLDPHWVADPGYRRPTWTRWTSVPCPGACLTLSRTGSGRECSGSPQQVDEVLRRHGVPAEALEIEITETTLMSDPERVLDVLACLSELGVRLALDDFGTGYSSLAQLKRLPVQEVKIDRAFVMGMGQDEEDAMIVRSTVDLAHNPGLQVTAEGVESDEALEALRALGCETAQGFLISRPLPAAGFDAWLRSHVPA
jgi:EAL domain-containing protein (putative c-di-GMP-specific phosphodiesterase class I)